MNNSEKVKAFSEILLLLFNLHKSAVGRNGLLYDQYISDKFGALQKSLYRREELEQLLPNINSRVKGDLENRLLCLPVPDHGNLGCPVLSVSYNFGCSIPEVTLRVAFLKKFGSDVRGYGYRLDPPHGMGREGGIHHFYHQQVIHKIAGKKLPEADKLSWISDKEPSFPLDAKDCVELLLCLIAGLYGRTKTNEILLGLERYVQSKVFAVLKEMNLSKFDGQHLTWYWKYESSNGSKVFYETDQQEEAFRNNTQHLHPNHNLIAIMPDEFQAQPQDSRLEYLIKA